MKRLFFLVPDLQSAHGVSQELLEMGVKGSCIHVMGGDIETLQKAHLKPATLFHTNVMPVIKLGLGVGLVTMVLIFILFSIFLQKGVTWTPLGLLAVIVFGMGFGLWSMGMLSLVRNPILEANEDYLKEGHFIMLVDLDMKDADSISQKIIAHHQGIKLAEKKL